MNWNIDTLLHSRFRFIFGCASTRYMTAPNAFVVILQTSLLLWPFAVCKCDVTYDHPDASHIAPHLPHAWRVTLPVPFAANWRLFYTYFPFKTSNTFAIGIEWNNYLRVLYPPYVLTNLMCHHIYFVRGKYLWRIGIFDGKQIPDTILLGPLLQQKTRAVIKVSFN
jgi:hypothetical protein